MRLMRVLAVLEALLTLGASPDTYTRDELVALEAEKAEAEARLAALETAGSKARMDLEDVDAALIEAAMDSRRREEQATRSERKLIDLSARLESAQIALLSDRDALEDLLAALASANRRRPPALIVSPDESNLAVRAAILMGDAAPRLSNRAEALSAEIETLNRIERDIRRERARLSATEATLALKKAEIEQLAALKRSQYEDLSVEADALRITVARLGTEADTLRGLLTSLEARAPAPPRYKPPLRLRYAALNTGRDTATDAARAAPPQPAVRLSPLGAASLGGLVRPAAGLVSRGFGDRMPTGSKAEGLYIVTRREAQVVAPADGRIEYAGAFRSYGEMLILRTSDGYHIVLSGLSEIYGSIGQTVVSGEPVGLMSNRSDPPPELYVELRKDGRPMNPADWMKRGR
ncbi:MAG: peptidoglycan DD-metalloendopeptidase family protein [Pseudomonadota bacterium]